MPEQVNVALTPQEWSFICAWRDVPPGQLKDLLEDLLHSLVGFVAEPTCAEVQADGVPCATPANDCEQCVKVKGVLQLVQRDLQRR